MSERIRKVPVWVFGLVVAGALAFGARRAFATPAFFICNDPSFNGGTCSTQQECVDNCDILFPGGYDHATCNTSMGCCRCYL